MRLLAATMLAMLGLCSAAIADDIEGRWRTDSGRTAEIASCGDAFCITIRDGKHSGKRIGRMQPNGANAYKGEITDPENDKTYSGRATLQGDALNMKGCVLGGLICRGQNWTRL